MKKITFMLLIATLLISCNSKIDQQKIKKQQPLVIYITDYCLSHEKLSNFILDFSAQNDIHIIIEKFTDSSDIYRKINSDSTATIPDIVIGFTNSDPWLEELDSLFINYENTSSFSIKKELNFYGNKFIPFCYYELAFVYNTNEIEIPPETFGSMQDGIWKDKIILPDPEQTSLGRAMLIWSVAAFGKNGYGHFWKSIKENIYRTENKWDNAYRMFLAREAPMVLGFSSIPLYHIDDQKTESIKSFIPQEGGFRLIESIALSNTCESKSDAEKILNYLMSENFQQNLSSTNYSYSVLDLDSDKSILDSIPKSDKIYNNVYNTKKIGENFNTWIKKWKKIMM